MPIDQVGFKALSDFVEQLGSREFSTTTIPQHLVAVRKVLTHAHGVGLIKNIPGFPGIKVVNKPRGRFSITEYRDLVRHARRRVGRKVPYEFADKSRSGVAILDRYTTVRADPPWVIRLMVNGFMRPSDIKLMKHKHVTVVRGKHIYLRLNLPETKLHDKPIVTLRLLYGKNVDLTTLARNARTSVNMIERFYSSNLSAEMNIDLLLGKRT